MTASHSTPITPTGTKLDVEGNYVSYANHHRPSTSSAAQPGEAEGPRRPMFESVK